MSNEISMLNNQVEDVKAEASKLHQGEIETVHRSLFENNHVVMLLIDPETAAIKDANPAACAYYGWSREKLKTLGIDEINTLTRDEIFAQMQLARTEKRRNFFFKHRRADGSVRDVEVFSGPLTVRGQTLLYSIVQDITDRVQAQKRLAESERRLSTLLENLPGMAYRCLNDEFWTMKFVSEGCFALTGYPAEHLIENCRTNYADLIHPDDRQAVWDQVQVGIDRRTRFNMTYRIRCADGAKKWVMEIGQGVFSETGELLAIEGFITDITERKRSEEALRQSEERHRQIVEASTDAILVRSDDSVVYANPAAVKLFRANHANELIGKRYLDLVHPDDRDESNERIRKGKNENWIAPPREHRIVALDGKVVHVESTGVPMQYQGKTQLFGVFRDIAKRKQAEDALRQSEEKFRLAFQTSPDSINLNRLSDGTYIDINEGFTKIMGYARGDVIGKTSLELSIWDDPKDREWLVAKLKKDGFVENLEAKFRGKDGRIRIGLMSARFFRLDREDVIISITRDITERKNAEDALRESENRYHQILEVSKDAILVRSGETIVFANPAAQRLLRASKVQDLVGKPYLDLVHPDDLPESTERVRKSMDGSWIAPPREHRMITIDGQVVHVESTGVPIRFEGQIQHFGMFRDITDRKRIEEALRESEEIFNAFMEHSPVYVFFKDERIRPIRLSRNFEQMLGRPIEDVLGKTMDELFPGELAKGMIADDLSVLNSGRSIKVIEDFNGRTFETTKFPIQQVGKPPMLAGFTIDITERRQADQQREKLEVQLRQAQKMEAIGSLAGGIAHDFNNILSVIIGNAEILKMTDISFSGNNEVDQILAASNRARDLVRQILAFSRQGEQQKILMSLKPVVRETIEFLRASIPTSIQLKHYINPGVGTIMADPTQMQQVLMNLCTNAAHAMEKDGGVLKIELDNIQLSEKDKVIDPEAEPGNYIMITVSDTGHGIAQEMLPRIFDPYFTTKGPDKGTGLGLAVLHGIVRTHGGIVKVYSEVGKGTVFHVLLPKAGGVVKKEEKPELGLPIGTERILVVDDEIHLLEMYKRMLGLIGYQVDTRSSPFEAIEALRSNPSKYDLLITDMTMPRMNGYKLAKKIMEIRPGLPVILCTGFSDQINEEKARSAGILAFLLKPVLFHDLANTLRKALDGSNKQRPG